MLNILSKNNKLYPRSLARMIQPGSGAPNNLSENFNVASGSIKYNNISVCNTGNSSGLLHLYYSDQDAGSISYVYKNIHIGPKKTHNFIQKNTPLYMNIESNQKLYIHYSGTYDISCYVSYDLLNTDAEISSSGFQLWFDNITPSTDLNAIPSGSGFEFGFNVYSSNGSGIYLNITGTNTSGLISGCYISSTGCYVDSGFRYSLTGNISQNFDITVNASATGTNDVFRNIDISKFWSIR